MPFGNLRQAEPVRVLCSCCFQLEVLFCCRNRNFWFNLIYKWTSNVVVSLVCSDLSFFFFHKFLRRFSQEIILPIHQERKLLYKNTKNLPCFFSSHPFSKKRSLWNKLSSFLSSTSVWKTCHNSVLLIKGQIQAREKITVEQDLYCLLFL